MICVLFTGYMAGDEKFADVLKNNYDNEDIRIIGVNSNERLLNTLGVDATYVVPRFDDIEYISKLKEICQKEKVDIIIPRITRELEFCAKNKEEIEKECALLSVSSYESVKIANDKTKLADMFSSLMPKQIILNEKADIRKFAKDAMYPSRSVCIKISNGCNGRGFAVLDEEKAKDLYQKNVWCSPEYITLEMAEMYFDNTNERMVMQEYIEGDDYSVLQLCDNGNVLYQQGFKATEMLGGTAMSAVIEDNKDAYSIASYISKTLLLDGNIDFDFKIDKNGRVYLLEINPRVSASIPFLSKSGMNLLYLRVKQMLKHDLGKYNVKAKIGYKMTNRLVATYHY